MNRSRIRCKAKSERKYAIETRYFIPRLMMRHFKLTQFAAFFAIVMVASATVTRAQGESFGKMLTNDEAIAFLQKMAQADPTFLDTPQEYTANGEHRFGTFRAALSQLIKQRDGRSQVSNQQSRLLMQTVPQVILQSTWVTNGVVGGQIACDVEMSVTSESIPLTGESQKATTTGIGTPVIFDWVKVTPFTTPWNALGYMQFASPGTITTTTVHKATNAMGQGFASSQDQADIRSPI